MNLKLEIAKLVVTPIATCLGVVVAAWFTVKRAKQALDDNRAADNEKDARNQRALLFALRSELSANIYLMIDEVSKDIKAPSLRIQKTIFSSNAQRVGEITSRAYGWLSVLYGRLGVYEQGDVQVDAERFEEHLGHAVLMRVGLDEIVAGKVRVQLTDFSDERFRIAINGYTEREQEILIASRAKWLSAFSERRRS